MSDPKEKLQALVDRQKKIIDAQKEAQAQLEKERQQAAINGTVQSSPSSSQPLNK